MPICPKCGDENPQLGAKCPRDNFYYIHEEAVRYAAHDPRIGTLAAQKYVIVGRISKGGMGAVYRALQLPVEREVALKVMRAELEDSAQGRDRFIREARAISRLSHPHIITLHDFGFEEGGHPYMVMEYAPGLDMGQWARQSGLSVERILLVIRQLLGALGAAHDEGIVHRDLKPENLLIATNSEDQDYVKLLDFGIARVVNEQHTKGLTREGETFGTPHYMSPEQASGAKHVGAPADLYAVGVMLYELLSGAPPYDAPTALAVLLMHVNNPIPALLPRPHLDVPDALVALIERSMQKAPEDRYASAAEMMHDLDAILMEATNYASGSFRAPLRTSAISSLGATPSAPYAPTLINAPALGSAGLGDVVVHDPDPSIVAHTDQFRDPDLYEEASSQAYEVPHRDRAPKIAVAALFVLIALAGTTALLLWEGNDSDAALPPDESELAAAPAPIPAEPIEPAPTIELEPAPPIDQAEEVEPSAPEPSPAVALESPRPDEPPRQKPPRRRPQPNRAPARKPDPKPEPIKEPSPEPIAEPAPAPPIDPPPPKKPRLPTPQRWEKPTAPAKW